MRTLQAAVSSFSLCSQAFQSHPQGSSLSCILHVPPFRTFTTATPPLPISSIPPAMNPLSDPSSAYFPHKQPAALPIHTILSPHTRNLLLCTTVDIAGEFVAGGGFYAYGGYGKYTNWRRGRQQRWWDCLQSVDGKGSYELSIGRKGSLRCR